MTATQTHTHAPARTRGTRSRRGPSILDSSGRPIEAAFFDGAATTRLNEKHWQHATAGDFMQAVRGDLGTLRRRARYEICNNGYGAGIADTLAFDIVGSGPRPQADSGSEAFDEELEEHFMIWAMQCDYLGQMDFAEILQMQTGLQQCEAGESLTALKRDEQATYGVSLRLLTIDVDRLCAGLSGGLMDPAVQDGIAFDAVGRPERYHLLKRHPNTPFMGPAMDGDWVNGADLIHLYRIKRPGQTRGIPWFAPALELFAQMRRFTLATLDAAETAADIAGTLEAESLEPDAEYQTNDVFELERKSLLMVPPGYRMNQVKPEHPATTYQMFKNEIINEIARGVLMPFNVAAANSSGYNYASGRLDHQKYHRFIETTRTWIERRFLNRVFAAWMSEAYLLEGFFRSKPTFEQAMRAIQTIRWFWPGFKHVDPVKEANADHQHLEDGTTTLEDIYAEKGEDWKRKLLQRSIELRFMHAHGIPMSVPPGTPPTPTEDDDDDPKTPQDD